MTDKKQLLVDYEAGLLGSILAGACIGDVADIVKPGDFYQPCHELIWRAALTVYEQGGNPDPHTVRAAIGDDAKRLPGGVTYLADLLGARWTGGDLRWVARQVADAAMRRRVQDAATRIAYLANSENLESAELAEAVRQCIDDATASGTRRLGSRIGDVLPDVLDIAEHGMPPGLATPWHDLNTFLGGGLRPGTLTVVGSRPGLGKSLIGALLATHVALKRDQTALVASLEMNRLELAQRVLSAQATVPLSGLAGNRPLSEQDWERIGQHTSTLTDLPLIIEDNPTQTAGSIRAMVRDVARRHTLGVVIVDYLQLLTPRDRRVPREQQVAEMSRGLKIIAREHNIPVVALAQVSRASTLRRDGRPTLADLRESGGIEADADTVILLHRDEDDINVGELEMLIAKNRHGPTGELTALFQGHYARIVSCHPQAETA